MAATTLRIDFVSDIACPWCAIGLHSLERAIEAVRGEIDVELGFEPFELNPAMAPGGEDLVAHLQRRYGASAEQLASNRALIRERGAAVGFAFGERTRVHNTFDGHRLLHWAGRQGRAEQRALKHALLEACHGRGADVSDHAVLLQAVAQAGLDADAARAVLSDPQRFAAEVRARESLWSQRGIHGVPGVVIDGRHLVSGGQPPEAFEEALRKVAGLRKAG
jgi:predicted DsbA family dithiol-disulfide isomerase